MASLPDFGWNRLLLLVLLLLLPLLLLLLLLLLPFHFLLGCPYNLV